VDRLSSGECRTEASKRPLRANEQVMIGNGGEAKFMTKFITIPRVFIAFNMLSVSERVYEGQCCH
jgi:hypothetical protein